MPVTTRSQQTGSSSQANVQGVKTALGSLPRKRKASPQESSGRARKTKRKDIKQEDSSDKLQDKARDNSWDKHRDNAKKSPRDSAPRRVKNGNGANHDGQEGQADHSIMINRAPVLQLWGASVAQFLHPEISWELCLSVGSSIATIIAISKGRSIGTIAEADPSKKKKDKKKEEPSLRVMGFSMTLKGDGVVVKGKVQTAKEGNLVSKYGGDEGYESVKTTMRESLASWKGFEKELDKGGFHMYEEFRPVVPPGQKGWGRKGKLDPDRIREVVQR